MIVGKLFVAMLDSQLGQAPCKAPRAVQKPELIGRAAVDIQGLEAPEAVRPFLEYVQRVMPQPVCPTLLNYFAGVECDRQSDTEKLRRIGIVAGGHREDIDYLDCLFGMLRRGFEVRPP